MFRQKLDEARVVSKDIDRPGFDLCEHPLVKVLDFERHLRMLAMTLTLRNLLANATNSRRVCSGAESLAESADRYDWSLDQKITDVGMGSSARGRVLQELPVDQRAAGRGPE
ncbi:MAG: hypothetical protein MZW92_07410 [Comamonadaceae bacterium]|nr:hypothetical protein [Comamonadaceae bacterium]